MEANFRAFDYTSDGSFIESDYRFSGDTSTGWIVQRNGREHLALGPGYRLLHTMYCGICSTDLDRSHLPFSLPQIIGHEAVAVDPTTGRDYVIEINDTCAARGDASPEIFCAHGLPTHCPDRMVLGIDRLPGGFGPWLLAPINACIPVEGVALRAATLAEPFAAALHAVDVSPPRAGDAVAVVGPGRLGLLIISALSMIRKSPGDFSITALGRSGKNLKAALVMGADTAYDDQILRNQEIGQFDLVFDASGSVAGLETSLAIARREIHLKSTHGRSFHGIKHLTEMVVDEISLLPPSSESFDFQWRGDNITNEWVYLSPGIVIHGLPDRFKMHRGETSSAESFLQGSAFRDRLPRFDMAMASSAEEIDSCIRPNGMHEHALVRPRGGIIFNGDPDNNPLLRFLAGGGRLSTSRCGDLKQAIHVLGQNAAQAARMEKLIITHEFPASRLPEAFEMAKKGPSIKVIIRHD